MKLWLTTCVAIACAVPAAAQGPDWNALEKEALATLGPAIQIIYDTIKASAGR
jgi:hypothetical protein